MNFLYELDPKWQKLLTLESFLGGLTVDEFVEQLSHNEKQDLDPRPFIRTFESTLKQLKSLQFQSSELTRNLENDVSSNERRYYADVKQLSGRAQLTKSEFSKLESDVSKVAEMVQPLGDALDADIKLQETQSLYITLIAAYNSFLKTGTCEQLSNLPQMRVAKIIAELLVLSKKLETDTLPDTLLVTQKIESYATDMEKGLLDEFSQCDNVTRMREVASIVNELNGGVNVIQSFINQHPFFEEKLDKRASTNDEAYWNKISDPDYHGSTLDDSMCDMLDHVLAVIKQEISLIEDVFQEDPGHVLQLFINRVVDKVHDRFESLLKASLAVSPLSYVRTLHSVSTLNSQFVSDIKSALGEHKGVEVRQFEVPSDYATVEKRSLETILYHKTLSFTTVHEKIIHARALSTKLQNTDGNEQIGEIKHTKFTQFTNYIKSHKRSSSRPGSVTITTEKSLSLDKVDSMLKCSMESIARTLELNPTKLYDILEVMMVGIMEYLEGGLEVAYSLISVDNLSFLQYVATATEVLNLIAGCIRLILPLCAMRDVKNKIIVLNNGYLKRGELLINLIIKETVQHIDNKIIASLGKQKKKDFLPSQEIGDHDTQPAEEISVFLNEVQDQAMRYLSTNNLNAFLLEVGDFLLRSLLDHFKKFQVNSTGGIVVTKDVIRYQAIIEKWSLPELQDRFTLLREIANLFSVQPDLLPSLTKEGKLATLRDIDDYMGKRVDGNSFTLSSFW